jgi:hypothetical protein
MNASNSGMDGYREVEDGVAPPVLQRRQVVGSRRRLLAVVRPCDGAQTLSATEARELRYIDRERERARELTEVDLPPLLLPLRLAPGVLVPQVRLEPPRPPVPARARASVSSFATSAG